MEADCESQYLLANGGISQRDCDSTKPTEKTRKKSLWRETNRRQKIALFFAAFSTASVVFSIGAAGIYLSRVVVSKGGDKLYAAAILTSTFLFTSIASLVCGKYQSKIPTKTFIWTGLLAVALSQACFGCLQYVDNIYAFVVLGLILKSIQGVGQGFVNVAILTLLWHEIPEHVEKSFGLIRSMTGAGYFFSAVSSGYLYSIQNGMMIPCVVSAVPPLLLSFIGCLILHDVENVEQSKDYRTWRYIINPKSVFVLGLAATCGGVFGVYSGSFSSYAKSVGISVVDVGLMFAVGDVGVMITSLLAGYFANVNHTCRQISIAICFLAMMGASASFTDNETLLLAYVQVTVFVITAAGLRTIAFPEMIHQSLDKYPDLTSNFTFRSQLSGVWYFATTVSSFVFGVGGTALQNLVTFAMSLIITSSVAIFLTIIATITIYLCRCQHRTNLNK